MTIQEELRTAADVIESEGIKVIAVIGNPLKFQLDEKDFRRRFAGKCVKCELSGGYRHLTTTHRDTTFHACEFVPSEPVVELILETPCT